MPERTDGQDQTTTEPPAVQTLPRIVKGSVGLIAFALVWFGIAGRMTWGQGWAFLLAFVAYGVALTWRLARADPDLWRERSRQAENVKPWDKALMGCYTGLLVVLLVLSALDSGRFRWSVVPLWTQLLAWVILCIAGTIIWHVMAVNAYLSRWARIQEDRGQKVVTEGLYRSVRHPMYLGIILGFVGLPLVLASLWALIPGLLIVGVFVCRTAREDGMLREELPGYQAYAEKVPHKLLPGIW